MSTTRLPTVTALMPAYNYARFVGRAVESAMAQDYPAELLDLVVVDDGSHDETAAIVAALAARYAGRIRLIRQQNRGPSAAVNRALAEASGELIAVLDADDEWLPDKTRRQAQMLVQDGTLGLVFCDMRVVDSDGQLVRPSQVGRIGPFPRRALAQLLNQNVITQSSLMIRRDLARQIPAGVPYSDWWFAVCAALESELLYIPEPLALYREHGSNLTSSVSGVSGVREHRKEIAFQLWVLRNLDLSRLAPAEVELVWDGIERHAGQVLAAAATHFVQLAEPPADGHAEVQALRRLADAAAEQGDLAGECVALLCSMGWDPYAAEFGVRLRQSVDVAKEEAAKPHPLAGARRFVTRVDAVELLDDDELLLAYADAMAGLEHVTLAIDATGVPPEGLAEQLELLVNRCGVDQSTAVDLLAVLGPATAPQRFRLLSRSDASYGRTLPEVVGGSQRPAFTPATLSELRALAERS